MAILQNHLPCGVTQVLCPIPTSKTIDIQEVTLIAPLCNKIGKPFLRNISRKPSM